MSDQYNDESIKVLNDIEHIKLRYGMYIGDQGPYQLFSEVLDNSLDEMGEGHGKEIIVTVDTKLNKYTVMDQGRGIPIGMKTLENGEQKEILEVICTKANSSGKFNANSYKYSAGINGLGITITNALSEKFEITTMRDGKGVTFKANNGVKESLDYLELPKEKHGTITSFIPGNIFKSKVISKDKMIDRCRVASALGYRVRLVIDGQEIDTKATIYDLISETDQSITVYKELPLVHVSNLENEEMKVAMRYTSDTADRYFGYTNMLTNSSGGTHVNELSKTIISAWQDFVDKKKLKLEVELKPGDYLTGLRVVCAIFISQPEFSSQTKEKLVVPKDRLKELMENFKDRFKEMLYENEDITLALIKRFEEYRIAQNKLLTNKDIMAKIKVNTDSSDNIRRRSISDKLVECTSKKRDNTELYIVEGNSACLRWNTKIRLANDTELTIKEVCEKVNNGEDIYVYGKQPKGMKYTGINVYKVLSGGITRRNALLYRVYFDNDTFIDCTYDHKFMTIKREFKELKDLTSNDSLSIMYYHQQRVKPNNTIICHNVYKKYYNEDIPNGYLVHHKDNNYFNNYPDNLELKAFSEQLTYHNQFNEGYDKAKGDPKSLSEIKNANHKITKVECLNIYEDVYDIEVDEVHNFCLFNDIIVHNCGPFVKTRNKELQAILPLRGKILNVTNRKVKDAIKNKEVCDIANCCGAGIGANNDASKSRYERVIIATDADVDGAQIACLVLSVFVNLFPDMIKQGRVFLAYPPLYAWKTKNSFDGCMKIEDIPKDIKSYSRIKGLGEFNDDQIKYFLIDPETRYLAKVEFPADVDKFNEILGTSQGRYNLMKDLGIIR